MNGVEKLITVMRDQGQYNNSPQIELAVMKSKTDIQYYGMVLTENDYLKAYGLNLEAGNKVALCYCQTENRYLVLCKVV